MKSDLKLWTMLLVLAMPGKVSAMRESPAEFEPVTVGQMVVKDDWRSNGKSYHVALIGRTREGQELWLTEIFRRYYNPSLEHDVQDIHLKSLKLDGTEIVAVDEKNQTYRIDSKTGKLLEPGQPVEYPTLTP